MVSTRGAVIVFVLLAVIQVAPALAPLDNCGLWNWNALCGAEQAEVTSVQRHGQFPLWNPWRAGGQVGYAQPESMFLTAVTPLALAVGVMPAFKLLLLPAIVFGACGFWLLAGRLGLSGAARLLPPLLVFGSTVPMQYLVNGLPNWLFGLALLPWLLLAFELALDDYRHVATAGLAWASVLWCGDIYHFVFDSMLVGLWAVGRAFERRSPRPLLVALAVGLAGACFAAIKLLPLFDLYGQYPRVVGETSHSTSPELLLRSLVDPFLPGQRRAYGLLRFDDVSVDWHATYAFIGPLAVVAALVGLVRLRRALAPLLVAGTFAWLACGASVRPNLWGLVSELPVYGSMRLPERLSVYVLIGLALLAGFGVDAVRQRWRAAAVGIVAVSCLLPALIIGLPLAAHAFPLPPIPVPPAPGPFRQEYFVQLPTQWGNDQQSAVLFNQGNVLGHRDVPTPGRVRPASHPLYRGEVYLRDGHGSVQADITPNRLHVRADVQAADVLVINQNWFPGWRATGTVQGPLAEEEGLPALPLPAGHHELDVRFTQPSVATGALLTLATAVVALLYVVRRGGRVVHRGGSFGLREGVTVTALLAIAAVQGVPRQRTPAPTPAPREPHEVVASRGQDLQALIDQAAPGDVVLLSAGEWPGFRLARGITVGVTGNGVADLTSPLVIEGVPHAERACLTGGLRAPRIIVRDCDGTVRLQSALAGDGGIDISECERVQLFGSEVEGPTRVRRAVLSAFQGSLRGGVDVDGGLLLLSGTSAGPVVLHASHLLAESGADAAVPALQLLDGSRALLSGGGEPASVEKDATSRIDRAEPPVPRVTRLALTATGDLSVRVEGAPGERAWLFAGCDTVLRPYGRDDNYQLVDLEGPNVARAVLLPPDGRLDLVLPFARPLTRPGEGWFAQVARERAPGFPRLDLSLMAGVLVRPPDDAGR